MEDFLYSLLKSAGLLCLFYGSYWLLLKKETFFMSNRLFLVLGILVSLVAPWVNFTKTVVLTSLPKSLMVMNETITAAPHESTYINWHLISISIYIIGVVYFGFKLMFQFLTLYQLKKDSKVVRKKPFYYVQTSKNTAPFSFFNHIFYHPEGYTKKELNTIIRHEKVHVVQKHSLDILLAEFLLMLQWFNPIAWLYNEHLKQNLEFLADDASQSSDRKFYQMLLLKEAVGANHIPLATSFYTSIIKKRIVMLNQKRSKNISLVKSVIILPVVALFLMAFNTKTVYELVETNSEGWEIVIKKNTNNLELEALKNSLAEKELDLSYTAVRNSYSEIINLELNIRDISKNKTYSGNSDYKTNNDGVISPVAIRIDNQNKISIGTIGTETATKQSDLIGPEISNIKIEVNKDSKKETYTEQAEFLAEKGIKIDFKGVKRNRKNEITDIKVFYDNGAGQKGSYVSKSNKPINPFTIEIQWKGEEPAEITLLVTGNNASNLRVAPNTTTNVIHTGQNKNTTIGLFSKNDSIKKNLTQPASYDTIKTIKIKNKNNSQTILLNNKEIRTEELAAEGHAETLLANTIKADGTRPITNHKTAIEHITITNTNGNQEHIKRLETNAENESEYIISKQKGKFELPTSKNQNDKITVEKGGSIKINTTKNEENMPLIYIDGKKEAYKLLKDIDPNTIESMNVLKGEMAMEQYGEEGKNGVIMIITKKE